VFWFVLFRLANSKLLLWAGVLATFTGELAAMVDKLRIARGFLDFIVDRARQPYGAERR
jgi:hypothetical protein